MISGRELAEMSREDIRNRFPDDRCACGKEIEEHPDDTYRIGNKPVCSDCYFSTMAGAENIGIGH